MMSQLVGALSPINHRGLHKGQQYNDNDNSDNRTEDDTDEEEMNSKD